MKELHKVEKQDKIVISYLTSALSCFLIISLSWFLIFTYFDRRLHLLEYSIFYIGSTIVTQLILFIIHIRKLNKLK